MSLHKTAAFPMVGLGVSQMVEFIHKLTLEGYAPVPIACKSGFGMVTITMVPVGEKVDVRKTNFEVNSNPDGSEAGSASTEQVSTESVAEVGGQAAPTEQPEAGEAEGDGGSDAGDGAEGESKPSDEGTGTAAKPKRRQNPKSKTSE